MFNFETKMEKWGHPYPMDTFIVNSISKYNLSELLNYVCLRYKNVVILWNYTSDLDLMYQIIRDQTLEHRWPSD